jgi:hypothetical protein
MSVKRLARVDDAGTAAARPAAIHVGPVAIDAAAYGSQGSAVLGTRDSGKTYTATLIAEQLFAAGIPFTVFDPVGVWRFLRVPGAGPGLPVVVAGGVAGDLALTPESAPRIVEAAMRNGVSLVLDLHSMDMSKADWRRIVGDSVRLLLHRNGEYGLRHVFIEEAHEFVPQMVRDGVVYAEMEKLATMGGNARLGYTLISQRSEQVNKAVLELCENMFLHRQRGRNSLVALGKWLNVGNVADHQAIVATLSTLPTGECWAWLGGSDTPVRATVQTKNSFHPNRRTLRGEAEGKPRHSVDVGAFVAMMRDSLATDAAAPAGARGRVKRGAPDLGVTVSKTYEMGFEAGKAEGLALGRAEASEEIGRLRGFLVRIGETVRQARDGAALLTDSLDGSIAAIVAASAGHLGAGVSARQQRGAERATNTDSIRLTDSSPKMDSRPVAGAEATQAGELTGAAARLFAVLIQRAPARMTWGQVATLSGLKASGGFFSAGKRALRAARLVDEAAGMVRASDAAISDAGTLSDPVQRPADVLAMWCDKLPSPSPAMLRALARHGPQRREQLAERLALQPSGGFWARGLAMLRQNRLVEIHGGVIELVAELRPAR